MVCEKIRENETEQQSRVNIAGQDVITMHLTQSGFLTFTFYSRNLEVISKDNHSVQFPRELNETFMLMLLDIVYTIVAVASYLSRILLYSRSSQLLMIIIHSIKKQLSQRLYYIVIRDILKLQLTRQINFILTLNISVTIYKIFIKLLKHKKYL